MRTARLLTVGGGCLSGGVSRGCAHPLYTEAHAPDIEEYPPDTDRHLLLDPEANTPPRGQIDSCENITLPQTSFVGINNWWKL